MTRRRWAISAIVALSLLLPAPAGAVTFGADLSVAPNVEYDCTVNPQYPYLLSGAEDCTWWTTGRINDTSEGHVVPYGGGTIVRARVRVGPETGPMQFVVLRSLREPTNNYDVACCFPVGHSEVFTPTPNAITTVPMNVRARHDYDPASGLNNFDHIAISVLAPGTPIPAFDTGDRSLNAPTGGAFYPAYEPGTERVTGLYGVVGFQTLINADIEPDAAPAAGTPTGPNDPLDFAGPGLLRDGRAFVPLACNSAQDCAGLIRLLALRQTAGTSAAKGKGARPALYGKARFKIPAGKTKRVKVTLTRAGKRLTRKRKRVKVLAKVTLSSKQTISGRVALRR